MNEKMLHAIEDYQTPEAAQRLVAEHPSLNIAGPTGAGKGTVALYLMQTENYAPVVSDTTRSPRLHNDGYEVPGVHYWFLDEAQAEEKVREAAYIEVKAVHKTTMYGTSMAAYEKVVASGRVPLLEIDVQGMEELMGQFPGFEVVFLVPPDFATWQERLDSRGDMDMTQKIRRLSSALIEFDKPFNNARFHPVVNTEVIDTAKLIKEGGYKEAAYRDRALQVTRELKEATQAFLDEHTSMA